MSRPGRCAADRFPLSVRGPPGGGRRISGTVSLSSYVAGAAFGSPWAPNTIAESCHTVLRHKRAAEGVALSSPDVMDGLPS